MQKFQRAHHQMNDPIAIRRFELEDDLTGRGAAQPFVAQGRAREIATQTFKSLPLMRSTIRIDMQAKPLDTDTALGLRYLWTGEAQRGVGGPSACQSVECHIHARFKAFEANVCRNLFWRPSLRSDLASRQSAFDFTQLSQSVTIRCHIARPDPKHE